MNHKLLRIITICTLLSIGASVQAATVGSTMAVSALVGPSCAVSASGLDFGNYDRTVRDASSTLTSNCTIGTAFNLGLDSGGGVGGSTAVRKLTSGFNLLSYTLYFDAARTSVWGSSVGADTVALTATASPSVTNVYGRIFGAQNVPSGSYTDTVNVTLTY